MGFTYPIQKDPLTQGHRYNIGCRFASLSHFIVKSCTFSTTSFIRCKVFKSEDIQKQFPTDLPIMDQKLVK